MEFTFNGVIPNSIYFNNNDLNRVTCNGVTVWEKLHPESILRFTSTGNSTISLGSEVSSDTWQPDVKYSLDGCNTWTQWDYSTISLTNGQTVYFRGYNPNGFTNDSYQNRRFYMTGSLAAGGSIMSLIDDGTCSVLVIPADYCFGGCFFGCRALTSVPELPATTLAEHCYEEMFTACSGLTSIPANLLPATTLAWYCYYQMFRGCSGLTTVPVNLLHATTLELGCYRDMFENCTGIASLPNNMLPAMTLTKECYAGMFRGCTSLTEVPTLPATSLNENCYNGMFRGCTSLTTVKVLPATRTYLGCYAYMFEGCTGLVSVPSNMLPHTTPYDTNLNEPYYRMFKNCSSLITTPDFKNGSMEMFMGCTSLRSVSSGAVANYPQVGEIFRGCTSLTTVPNSFIPENNNPTMDVIAKGKYSGAFYGCTSLTTAPDLLCRRSYEYGYHHMFDGCTNLNFVRCMLVSAQGFSFTGATDNWLRGVSATGTFVRNTEETGWLSGEDGIPTGWTVRTESLPAGQ